MFILIVSRWNCGIGNGGLWYGFSSLLISHSCQAPIVPYNNSDKAFCFAMIGACKVVNDIFWQVCLLTLGIRN